MFCPNCGNELPNEANFCAVCGGAVRINEQTNFQTNTWTTEDVTAENLTEGGKTKKGRKGICVTIGIIAFAVLAVILITLFKPKKVKLKYAWGTHYSEIEEKENLIGIFTHEFSQGSKLVLTCEDPYHEVDGIKELADTDKVQYWTDFDGKLYRINYSLDEELSITEKVDILSDYYGNDYYVIERKNIYENKYYWWIDDTVVEFQVSFGEIDYYDADYIRENDSYDKVVEFFEK